MQKRNSTIDVSIVTLNYKQALLTKQCVRSLLRSRNVTFEILVIDNSCSAKDVKALRKIRSKKVTVFTAEKNLGCAAGYNFGIQNAKGKYVFIINNDTRVSDPNALSKMTAFLKRRPKIGVLQPKIKSLRNSKLFEYAGAAGGHLDILGYPFCKGRIFSTIEEDRGQYNRVEEITWASTCAFFAKKSVLYEAGLFDPIYFAYAEEVDISLKIWLLGYKIVFFPGTEIFHKGEASWKKTRGRKTFLIHRNHLILYMKCLPLKQVIRNLPMRVVLEYLSMFYYISHKSYLHIFFVLFSHLTIIFLFPEIIRKRLKFFSGSENMYPQLYTDSIVMDYFWRHKELYSDLDRKKFRRGMQ